jgi:hypothetical protein
MNFLKNRNVKIIWLLILAAVLRFGLMQFLEEGFSTSTRVLATIFILVFGTIYVLRGIAKVIEETTEVLSERTKIAGGLLQAVGTALPDMILGVLAAAISLGLRSTNYALSINYAIIAAAATFGSNIYNIGYASWCIYRQNLANKLNTIIPMIPGLKRMGELRPMSSHIKKPLMVEIDTSLDISTSLTFLTAVVAIGMVVFGKVKDNPLGAGNDLYQLIRPVGVLVLVLSLFVIYHFRKSQKTVPIPEELEEDVNYYRSKSSLTTWVHLFITGAAILFTAESMVRAVEALCQITGLPFVVAGVLAGIIGCLGEMIVIHNFSVNPNGRIGDAVVGVSMDNIVTIVGAAIVAVMGGIFLGGNALILIFVIILTINSTLVWQMSKLKNFFLKS